MNDAGRWLILIATLAGCTSEDGHGLEEDQGSAPRLESFALSSDPVPARTLTSVIGTLSFEDDDGDLELAEIEVTMAADVVTAVTAPFMGVDGVTEGTVPVQLQLLLADAGPADVELVLVDAEGNMSEPAVATVEVVDP